MSEQLSIEQLNVTLQKMFSTLTQLQEAQKKQKEASSQKNSTGQKLVIPAPKKMGKKGNTILFKPTKDHMIEAMEKNTDKTEAETKHSLLHDICFGIVTNTIDKTYDGKPPSWKEVKGFFRSKVYPLCHQQAKEALGFVMDAFCNNWMIKRIVVRIYENKVRYFNTKTAKKGKRNTMPVSIEEDATDDESDESTDEAEDEGQAGASKRQNNNPSSSSKSKRGKKRHCK